VPVHPSTVGVEQDRPGGPVADRGVDRPADRRRQRDEDGLLPLANDAQDAVAVFLTEVGDVEADGFEDPQAEEPEQADQREVVPVRRLPSGGQQRLKQQMGEPEGG